LCTLTAGLQKVLHPARAIGFVSHAWQFSTAGKILAPAKTLDEMHRIIFNDYVDATLAALFVMVVVAVAIYGVTSIRKALGHPQVTAVGTAGAMPEASHA
jgi:hypothetical protein